MRAAIAGGMVTVTAILVSCAPSPPPAVAPRPDGAASACTDPMYQALKETHPDSLSDRSWQRLQDLERMCEEQREAEPDPKGIDGMHHDRWRTWAPAMLAMGVVMMAMTVFAVP